MEAFKNLTSEYQIAIISAGAAMLGAIIGAAATLLATWLEKRIQQQGKVRVYVKFVGSKLADHRRIGFYKSETSSGLGMRIPVWVEVCNTCGVSRILRDVNFYAYQDKQEVFSFKQIQRIGDGENKIVLGNNETYTLVIPPNSACRFNMEFHKKEADLSEKQFNKLYLAYYDEKNVLHTFYIMDIEQCWSEGEIQKDNRWQELKKGKLKHK